MTNSELPSRGQLYRGQGNQPRCPPLRTTDTREGNRRNYPGGEAHAQGARWGRRRLARAAPVLRPTSERVGMVAQLRIVEAVLRRHTQLEAHWDHDRQLVRNVPTVTERAPSPGR